MSKLIVWLLAFGIFFSCRDNEKKPVAGNEPAEQARQEDVPVFPVTDYILGQLNQLDSLPVTFLKMEVKDGKTDSTWLKKGEVKKYARPFLYPTIDSATIRSFFSRRSFMDQTINAITFTYDVTKPLPDSSGLTECSVYVDPQNNTVQRVYLVKKGLVKTSQVDSQLTWKANRWFSIRTISEAPGTKPVVTEQVIKWDFREDMD